jgi:hypothetical protein
MGRHLLCGGAPPGFTFSVEDLIDTARIRGAKQPAVQSGEVAGC